MKKPVINIVVALGLALSAGWYVTAQSASGDALPTFAAGDTLSAADLNAIVDGVRSTLAAVNGTGGTTITVDCDTGGATALADAIQAAAPGSTINVTGTCNEAVTITKDGLTLDGQNQASTTIDGGSVTAITIDGARRVTIKNLTVQNGEHGINATSGASVTLAHITAQRNTDDGFHIVKNATAHISNCTAQDNGDDGFAVSGSSQATFTATITSTGNADDGLNVNFSSSGFINGATVSANANGNSATFGQAMFNGSVQGDGIRVTDSAHVFIQDSVVTVNANADEGIAIDRTSSVAAFEVSDTSAMLTITGNGGMGIFVTNQSYLGIAHITATITNNADIGISVQNSHGVARNLTLTGNGGHGLNLLDNASFTIREGNATISANANSGVAVFRSSSIFLFPGVQLLDHTTAVGLLVGQNSQADARSPVIRNNRIGVSVDASNATLVDATVTGNTDGDLNAYLGSQLSLEGTNTVGTVFCEASVVSRGNPVCP